MQELFSEKILLSLVESVEGSTLGLVEMLMVTVQEFFFSRIKRALNRNVLRLFFFFSC